MSEDQMVAEDIGDPKRMKKKRYNLPEEANEYLSDDLQLNQESTKPRRKKPV